MNELLTVFNLILCIASHTYSPIFDIATKYVAIRNCIFFNWLQSGIIAYISVCVCLCA